MTVRAVIIGLLLAAGIAAFGYFNDWVMKQAFLATNLTPVVVYGFLVLGLLLVNPLLAALGRWQLRGAEWAVVLGLMLVACVVPPA